MKKDENRSVSNYAKHEGLYINTKAYLDELGGEGALAVLEVLLQILVNELKDQVETTVGLDNVVKTKQEKILKKCK